jgi:hypothetical protein
MLRVVFPLCCAMPLLLAAAATTEPAHKHQHAEPVQGVSSLDLFLQGETVHLLTATQDVANGKPPVLFYQRSDDGGAAFSTPVSLGQDQPPTIAKRGMDAQIAVAGNNVVVVWCTAGTDKMGRGPMATCVSNDGGRTFHAGPNPADDGLTIGHSFIDVTADASGTFHLVWLDGRAGEEKGLRYSRSEDGGKTWSTNQTLNPVTCECCWNSFAIAPDGTINVLYRRRDPRDMALIQSRDGGRSWGKPVTVGEFAWGTTACPHVGGAIGFTGTTANAVVWTAKDNDVHGIYFLSSANAGSAHDGSTWTPPVRVGSPEATRPDLVIDGHGQIVIAWDAYEKGQQSTFAARSADGGKTWSPSQRLSAADSSATHARLISTPAGVRAFWTERRPGQRTTWTSHLVP